MQPWDFSALIGFRLAATMDSGDSDANFHATMSCVPVRRTGKR